MSAGVGNFRGSGGRVIGQVALKELRCEALKSVRVMADLREEGKA